MFRQILATQWKWSALVVLVLTMAGFAVPVLSVQGAAPGNEDPWQVPALLSAVRDSGVVYPLLASAAALLVALTAWAADHRGRHVYALSLPIPRWHYTLLRYGAGALLLAVPATGVLAGALLATGTATLPTGLHAYPIALATRYVLASLLAYSIFFAISAGTSRTAGYVLGTIAGLLVVQLAAALAGAEVSVVEWVLDRLLISWGPLEIFTGGWMLIDV